MSPTLALKVILVVALILAIPAAFFGHQAYTNSTSYLLARGNEAVEKLNRKEVERIQKLLEKKGEIQAAYLIHGKYWVYVGDTALSRQTPAPAPFEDTQQTAQMVLGAAGLCDQAATTRPVLWTFATFYQKPLGVTSPALNAFRTALAELAKIQDDGPIGVEGTVLAAESLLRLDEKRLAEEGLKILLKRNPDNRDAHRLLSVIYIDLNSPGSAIKHLQEWARLDPSDGLPYRWIGFFRKDNSQQTEAIEAYQEALRRNLKPDMRADAIKELAEIYLLLEGNPSKALDTLAQGTEAFQREPEILTLRVESLSSLGRAPEALELVEQALRDNPQNSKIIVMRAQMFINENKPEQAIPLLEKAVRLDPYNLRALTLLMNTYSQLQKPELAAKLTIQVEDVTKIYAKISDLRTKALSNPWDPEVRYELAGMFLMIGHLEDARTWLQAALACNPAHAKARRLLNKIPPKEKVAAVSDTSGNSK